MQGRRARKMRNKVKMNKRDNRLIRNKSKAMN